MLCRNLPPGPEALCGNSSLRAQCERVLTLFLRPRRGTGTGAGHAGPEPNEREPSWSAARCWTSRGPMPRADAAIICHNGAPCGLPRGYANVHAGHGVCSPRAGDPNCTSPRHQRHACSVLWSRAAETCAAAGCAVDPSTAQWSALRFGAGPAATAPSRAAAATARGTGAARSAGAAAWGKIGVRPAGAWIGGDGGID